MDPVGRYQIVEELGRGAHGVVYKALDPAIGRTIAIKAIAIGEIQASDREQVRSGILAEAKFAGTLSHPDIVAIYDVVDSEQAVYIVMEFVEGESLERAISTLQATKGGLLSRAHFISILKQVAQALDYAHRKGIVHRDVKPANILLKPPRPDSTGELLAKIADFGVAKFASHETTRQLNGAPAMVGTPNYMSPEQAEGLSLTGASDQFSLAGIAYEILTGQKAFIADTLEDLLHRIRWESEEAVSILNRSLSPTVSKVMLRALSKKPEQRYQNCAEFAGALEFALGDSPRWSPGMVEALAEPASASIAADGDALSSPVEERSPGTKLALVAALCLAVFLAIVLIVRMNSGSSIPAQDLDTKNAPATPPTAAPPSSLQAQHSVDELREEKRSTPDSAPTVVKVPAEPATTKMEPVKAARPAIARASTPVRAAISATTTREVQFSSDPPNAHLLVDGSQSCEMPCSLTLAGGRHTLSANLNGYGVARKIFQVPEESGVFVPLARSEGVLLVSSDPTGANVNVDGQAFGRTPVTLRLAPGTHRVSVWDGTRWHDESVLVSTDEVHTRLFRF